eukprot:maker-scaffold_7-snap-gene-11.44-mRNA-1 protein AED:0.43 eAED:0.53 QI:0/0/0/1/1/1/3/0/60
MNELYGYSLKLEVGITVQVVVLFVCHIIFFEKYFGTRRLLRALSLYNISVFLESYHGNQP